MDATKQVVELTLDETLEELGAEEAEQIQGGYMIIIIRYLIYF